MKRLFWFILIGIITYLDYRVGLIINLILLIVFYKTIPLLFNEVRKNKSLMLLVLPSATIAIGQLIECHLNPEITKRWLFIALSMIITISLYCAIELYYPAEKK